MKFITLPFSHCRQGSRAEHQLQAAEDLAQVAGHSQTAPPRQDQRRVSQHTTLSMVYMGKTIRDDIKIWGQFTG